MKCNASSPNVDTCKIVCCSPPQVYDVKQMLTNWIEIQFSQHFSCCLFSSCIYLHVCWYSQLLNCVDIITSGVSIITRLLCITYTYCSPEPRVPCPCVCVINTEVCTAVDQNFIVLNITHWDCKTYHLCDIMKDSIPTVSYGWGGKFLD